MSIQKMADLVFEEGFPVRDLLSPIHGVLVDLQRFRNFVAHDSSEAVLGFKKSRTQYVRVGHALPETVGELSLYRKNSRADITIKILHQKVSSMSGILQAL